MDFVKDSISHHDYCIEEDPKIYKSKKTNRGPLNENWVQEHIQNFLPIMCAYKMCKVEFKYWGLQTRAERWIHELALKVNFNLIILFIFSNLIINYLNNFLGHNVTCSSTSLGMAR